jgi:hypothetical protein
VDQQSQEDIPAEVRDVWIAAIKATAGYFVEQTKLNVNPFAGIKVRKDDPSATKENKVEPRTPPRKGFNENEARIILTATLATPSHLTSAEMKAAKRWLPGSAPTAAPARTS